MIHREAIERVTAGGTDGRGLLRVFEDLAKEAEDEGNETAECCVTFFEEGDDFKVGTWVPELWVIVRKVLPDES
jgi:hypothetical protein